MARNTRRNTRAYGAPGIRPRRPLRALVAAVEQLNRTAPVHAIDCPCDLCKVFLALAYLPPAWRKAA
jgi:hypothetical protein